jgi:hypothetical protein
VERAVDAAAEAEARPSAGAFRHLMLGAMELRPVQGRIRWVRTRPGGYAAWATQFERGCGGLCLG